MARALFTILVALPLLAPPGVCLCGGAANPGRAKSQAAKPVKKSCSCCGHCRPAPAVERNPAPPQRHEQDCPAALCASVVEKWDDSPRVTLDLDSIPLLTMKFSVCPARVSVSCTETPPTISPPAYLAHQSFLL
jgi:hypothetical protein